MWEAGNVKHDWIDANGWRHIEMKNGRVYYFRHNAGANSRPTKRAPDAPKAGAKVVKSKSKVISGQARR